MSEIRIDPLDHTADAGLRAVSDSLPLVFTGCAERMVRICCPEGDICTRRRRSIAITGHDLVELLIGWLSEINSLMNIHRELYGEFSLESLQAAGPPPYRLQGSVGGESIDPRRHRLAREIKAVTFHGAYVLQEGPQWRAQVIFDL
jgi:SHS2 domain-containing protein